MGIDVLGSHMGAVLMMRAGVRYRIGVRGYRGGWSGCQDSSSSRRRQCGRAALGQAELLGAKTLPEARPQLFLTDDERLQAAQIWNAGEAGGRRTVRIVAGVGPAFQARPGMRGRSGTR